MSKSVHRPAHCAKYLILVGPPTAPRALLFGSDHRYLAEMLDDDGLVLDGLRRAGRVCAPPSALPIAELADADDRVQCYRLD